MSVGAHQGSILLEGALKDPSPATAGIVARPAFVDLIMIARYSSAITIRKLEKIRFSRSRGYMTCQGPHSEVVGRKRKSMDLGFYFY